MDIKCFCKSFLNDNAFIFDGKIVYHRYILSSLGAPNTPAGPLQTDHLVINEVEYDSIQSGTDNAYEWFELYNPTISDISMSGWNITDNVATDTILDMTVLAGDWMVVVANKTSFQTNYPGVPDSKIVELQDGKIGNGLSNSGDKLILKNGSGSTVDAVEWGTDYGDVPGSPAPDVNPGHSIARSPDGKDTNDCSVDFVDSSNPTPGQAIPEFRTILIPIVATIALFAIFRKIKEKKQ